MTENKSLKKQLKKIEPKRHKKMGLFGSLISYFK